MDNKKGKNPIPEDLRGFEEFLEDQNQERHFLPRGVGGGTRRETNFEHFTFLSYDAARLAKVKELVTNKLHFTYNHNQGEKILNLIEQDLQNLREEIYGTSSPHESNYHRSLRGVFNSFYNKIEI